MKIGKHQTLKDQLNGDTKIIEFKKNNVMRKNWQSMIYYNNSKIIELRQ